MEVMDDAIQKQIMTVAELILKEKTDLVDGCRHLVRLFHRLDNKEWIPELFDPIVAFESETEDLPVGELRSMWALQALAHKEAKAKSYLEEARIWIFEACRGLTAKYGRETREET